MCNSIRSRGVWRQLDFHNTLDDVGFFSYYNKYVFTIRKPMESRLLSSFRLKFERNSKTYVHISLSRNDIFIKRLNYFKVYPSNCVLCTNTISNSFSSHSRVPLKIKFAIAFYPPTALNFSIAICICLITTLIHSNCIQYTVPDISVKISEFTSRAWRKNKTLCHDM